MQISAEDVEAAVRAWAEEDYDGVWEYLKQGQKIKNENFTITVVSVENSTEADSYDQISRGTKVAVRVTCDYWDVVKYFLKEGVYESFVGSTWQPLREVTPVTKTITVWE